MAATDIASAVEQMSASVSQINSSAQEALARAEETANAAHQGVSSIELSGIESNKAIQQVNHTSQSIQALGRESERISSIISVITGIAEQINLLALNAAIEAARAGNHGRGFAVVADEVRSLALRTSTSAAEVREMVNAIQHSTRNAIDDMKLVVTSTEQSRSLIETASERMAEILQCAGAVAESINSVSQAMLEQHKSTELISQRVEHVAQMSQENCSISESAAAVSSELDNAASNLHQAIHRFKV
ncbi:methyl-accepting chemotaxis protein [Pseudomonas sp. TTU2014-080ASC]